MIFRRIAFISSLIATAASCFTLGMIQSRGAEATEYAAYDARLDALREELQRATAREALGPMPTGTMGLTAEIADDARDAKAAEDRARMIAEVKEQLRNEMGLLPVRLLRERSSSFVELYAYDNTGQKDYGTAGYLGNGYFVTVKHAVVVLSDKEPRADDRKITALKIVYKGKEIPARLIDVGDAKKEVDSGDWAIIKTRNLDDLPPLRVDTAFAYEFAEPIFRLGNDYSKGIVVSTGYVGQRTPTGLVTALTDGHPGVSGGGVLDQRGALVGIPIGRMQGDYRFSFILPLRVEMMRKVPGFLPSLPADGPTE